MSTTTIVANRDDLMTRTFGAQTGRPARSITPASGARLGESVASLLPICNPRRVRTLRGVVSGGTGDLTQWMVKYAAIHSQCTEVRLFPGRQNACPPDDVGGPWGYANFLEAIADPDHEEHDDYVEWIGGPFDPTEFDLAGANARCQKVR